MIPAIARRPRPRCPSSRSRSIPTPRGSPRSGSGSSSPETRPATPVRSTIFRGAGCDDSPAWATRVSCGTAIPSKATSRARGSTSCGSSRAASPPALASSCCAERAGDRGRRRRPCTPRASRRAGGFANLQREVRAVGGEWSLYRYRDEPPGPAATEAVGGQTRIVETAVVDLEGGLDAAWSRMERKTRQAIDGARVAGLVFAEEPEALPEAYALYLRQARAWTGHRARPAELSRRLLARPGLADGAGRAAQGLEASLARLFTVRDARGLLSAVLALDHPRELMPWWSGT